MKLIHDDCLAALKKIPDNSIDSLLTDPPAGISFMGKEWDHHKGGRKQWVTWMTSVMSECLRVLKPGAHGLVWALPRTSHWTATALEDAGFEIRDVVTHNFGQGFPKSLNVFKKLCTPYLCQLSKNVKLATQKSSLIPVELPGGTIVSVVVGVPILHADGSANKTVTGVVVDSSDQMAMSLLESTEHIDLSTILLWKKRLGEKLNAWKTYITLTELKQITGLKIWSCLQSPNMLDTIVKSEGQGTALKPASEHWILVRKPLSEKTVAANVLKWGCGGINIDGSRVGTEVIKINQVDLTNAHGNNLGAGVKQPFTGVVNQVTGRFPSNLVFSHEPECTDEQCTFDCAVKMLDGQSGRLLPQGGKKKKDCPSQMFSGGSKDSTFYGDSGGASRFFLCVKHDSNELCGNENTRDDDTFAGKRTENKKENLSTDGFGNKPTDKFLMGTISITEMGTHSIMSFPILSACTKTFIGTITIESGKTIDQSTVSNIVGVSVVSSTEALMHFQNGQQEPITGIVSLASDSTSLAGVIETVSTGTRTIGHIAQNRFFYTAKISSSERDGSTHPTMKTQRLMRYFAKMITPPNGTVLDPFMGSGSTGLACKSEGFQFVGIEKELEYFEIARKRVT